MTAAVSLVERLARAVSTGCGCYAGRGLCESCRIAFDALLPVVEQAVAEARGEAWDEGKWAMARARLMQGGDDPQNPYRADAIATTEEAE